MGTVVSQRPAIRAAAQKRAIVPTPAAGTNQGDHKEWPLFVTVRQFFTGQAATHDMQPVHSGVHTDFFRWTVISTGQARVQLWQSVHAEASRTTRCGDSQLTNPRSAP